MELLDWPDERALRTLATKGPPQLDETTEALNTIVAALTPQPPRQTMCG
jgi:hypothetical protein